MSAANIFPNGIAGATGAALATAAPLYTPGSVWYVNVATGTDAVSPAGKDRNKPLATLAQAYSNAAAGDTIVCLSGHAETLTAALTCNKAGVTILSEGTLGGRAKFTRNANVILFDCSAQTALWNLYLVAGAVASSSAKVNLNAAACVVRDCYFECGPNDTGSSLVLVGTTANNCVVRDTTFISAGTSLTAQPHSGLAVNTGAVTDLDLDTVSFDGGTYGWSNQFALVGTTAVTRLRAINIDLLNDSDVTLASGTSGYFLPRNKSGSARVVWTP